MALSKLASSVSIQNVQTLILGRRDRHDRHDVDSHNVSIAEDGGEADDDDEERQNLLQNAADIQRRRPHRRPHHHHPDAHRHRNLDHDHPQVEPQRTSFSASQHVSETSNNNNKPVRQSSLTKVWHKLSIRSKRSPSPSAAAAADDRGGRDGRDGRGRGSAAVVKKEVRIFLEARPHMNHATARAGACTPHSSSSSLEALPETSALVITNNNNNTSTHTTNGGGNGRQQQQQQPAEFPSSEQSFKRATHNRRAMSRFVLTYPSPPTAPAIILPLHEPAISFAAHDALWRRDHAARPTRMCGDEIMYALRAPMFRSSNPNSDNGSSNSNSNSDSMVPFTPVPQPNWPAWSNSRLSELAHNLLPRAGGWEMRFKCEAKPWLEFRLETPQEREMFWEWLREEWEKALPCVPGDDGTTVAAAAKNKMNEIRSYFFGSKNDSEKKEHREDKASNNQLDTSQTEAGALETLPRCEVHHPDEPPTKREVAKQKAAARAAHRKEKTRRASEDADPNWVCFSKKKHVMRLDLTVNFVYRAPTQLPLPPRPSQF